jgi:4-hydroxy-2-oxoheptanedioate aldolase
MRAKLESGETMSDYYNRNQVVGIMCETVGALEDLDRIVTIKGLDFVFFGPSDLSASMGLGGQPGHPAMREAFLKGIETVKSAGVAWGTMPNHPAVPISPDELVEMGARILVMGADSQVILRGMEDLAKSVAHLKR